MFQNDRKKPARGHYSFHVLVPNEEPPAHYLDTSLATPTSRLPVTQFTDNGARIGTVVARGGVSLRPDVSG